MAEYTDSNLLFKKQKTSISIFSYNSRGFDMGKQDLCREILMEKILPGDQDEVKILCNQENFLLRNNKYKIKQALEGHHIVFKPAIKDSLDGRPKNGMFIAIPNKISGKIKDISPNHWRLQAILVNAFDRCLLIINSYFPQDSRYVEYKDEGLEETLAEIQEILEKNHFDDVLLVGDINADFTRKTGFIWRMRNFINDTNLCKAWDSFPTDFTHEHTIDGTTYVSTIDHIFWNPNLREHVTEAGVVHVPENTSDHHPIYCRLNYSNIGPKIEENDEDILSKPSWKRSTNDQQNKFVDELKNKLEKLSHIEECHNPYCKAETHVTMCDELMLNILETIEMTARNNLSIPRRKTASNKTAIAYWKEEVKPFRDDAMFWNAIWKSAGKPLNTHLHSIMKRTRNIYHFQIRKCKNIVNYLKKNTLLDACINNRGDIFKELRKLRRTKDSSPDVMDGVSENIQDHFAGIYSKLYNSGDDQIEVEKLYNRINARVTSICMKDVSKVTPLIVKEAVGRLKSDKTDPVNEFSSDCVKNAPDVLYELLAQLFRAYLTHGHITKALTLSTLIPLIKDKIGDHGSSNNYRSIALSSLILKILDWVFIILCKDEFRLDDLQFSYQENCSTDMCTWMVVETIDYYSRNGSEVFTSVMDMTKAFDNVSHSKLFAKTIERGIPEIYIRLLMVVYKHQQLCVKWNGKSSYIFGMSNGVKQGAVLSALLYCLYVDELFETLRKRRTGCWVEDSYVGILGYADDTFLLAPTLDGLQEMINTCNEFCSKYNLTFSVNTDPRKCKTKCLAFLKKKRDLRRMKLGAIDLPWVESTKHLGNKILNRARGMGQDVLEKRAAYISRNNELVQELHFAHPKTLVNVNNIYNSHFYGCTLWDLSCKEVDMAFKTWNVSQRMMHGLDRKTHKYLIEPVSGTKHIKFAMYKRFINFTSRITESAKVAMKVLYETVKLDCQSTIGRNLRMIMLEYGLCTINDITTKMLEKKQYVDLPGDESWRVNIIKEIIDTKHGRNVVPEFTTKELQDMLDFASTS